MRDASKATTLTQAYPDVRIVSGDLDSLSLLEEEASQADIVIRKPSPVTTSIITNTQRRRKFESYQKCRGYRTWPS